MGLELGKTSIEKILHPEPVDSSPLIFAILCASILVKLYMFLYNRRLGKKLASPPWRPPPWTPSATVWPPPRC